MKAIAGIPDWLLRFLVTAIVGALITGFSAWGAHLTTKSGDHEKRISVIEEHQNGIDVSLREIKDMQKTQAEDTKKILERLPRR